MIIPYQNTHPQIGNDVFIAPDAHVIGDVEIADTVTILFHAVIRGDLEPIKIGKRSNVQDHCMIHTTSGFAPSVLGEEVTMGHGAIVHSATIGNRVILGMNSTVLDGAEIGDNCIVAAGTVVTPRTKIPAGSMVMGTPGKPVRELREEEIAALTDGVERYVAAGAEYRKHFGS